MFASSIIGNRVRSWCTAARERFSRASSNFRLWRTDRQVAKTVICRPKLGDPKGLWSLTDRQERIAWFKKDRVAKARVLVVGCGGLGSNAMLILVRMGFTSIACCDPDVVEDSNRNRQFFRRRDVGKPKAHAIVRNVAPFATAVCRLTGFFGTFGDFKKSQAFEEHDVILCGVDNDEANREVAAHAAMTGIPVVFVNVSRDAEAFRVFIQRPGEACFSCYRPLVKETVAEGRGQACTPDPAVGDCLMAAVSFGCRALVLEVCGERISKSWNCRDITFYGLDLKEAVQRRSTCPLCRKAA